MDVGGHYWRMTDSAALAPDDSTMRKRRVWRRLRLASAGLLLGSAAIAAIWFYRVCTVVEVRGGANADVTQTTCAPPGLSSAPVLAVLLLVLAMLWPDVSEFAVLGVSLKRRVDRAEAVAATAHQAVNDLRGFVQFQQVQIDAANNSSAASSAVVNFLVPDRWGALDSASLRDERRSVTQEALGDAMEVSTSLPPLAEFSDAELRVRVLTEYEAFATILDLNTQRARGRPTVLQDQKRNAQQGFIEDFENAILTLRTLRNAIAHARDVPRADIEEGLRLLSNLEPLAQKRLGIHQ